MEKELVKLKLKNLTGIRKNNYAQQAVWEHPYDLSVY